MNRNGILLFAILCFGLFSYKTIAQEKPIINCSFEVLSTFEGRTDLAFILITKITDHPTNLEVGQELMVRIIDFGPDSPISLRPGIFIEAELIVKKDNPNLPAQYSIKLLKEIL